MIERAILRTGPAGWTQFDTPAEVVLVPREAHRISDALHRLEDLVETRRLPAVGFLTYEAAAAYGLAVHEPASREPASREPAAERSSLPLLCFVLFRNHRDVSALMNTDPPCGRGYRAGPWTNSLDEAAYGERIQRVRSYLRAGDTYQVNFTFPMTAPFTGDPEGYFRDMCAAQDGRYAAYLELDSGISILSASPELFLQRRGPHLRARPMKGTAPRGLTVQEDRANARELRRSLKERAENLMITDMIRNDLGRVAVPGSVCVPRLFEVERYPRVLQMVSRVEARSDASLADLIAATFPCASITGAPKKRTMEIIRELESVPRGIYTGTIGLLQPGRRMRFNVAIRTVVVDRHRESALFGVGGGIVWDSRPEGEYRECATKANILAAPEPPVTLLETMRWNARRGITLGEGHLRRLRRSAQYFRISLAGRGRQSREHQCVNGHQSQGHQSQEHKSLNGHEYLNGHQCQEHKSMNGHQCLRDVAALDRRIRESLGATGEASHEGDWRVRLLVRATGVEIEAEPLPGPSVDPLAADPRAGDRGGAATLPVRRVTFSPEPVPRRSSWIVHKTTRRELYRERMDQHPQAEDVVLCNDEGNLTESCTASILVRRGDVLVTPPLTEGLLPGVFREWLLEHAGAGAGAATTDGGVSTPGGLPIVEEPIPASVLEEVRRGETELYLVNSVRGWMRAQLL